MKKRAFCSSESNVNVISDPNGSKSPSQKPITLARLAGTEWGFDKQSIPKRGLIDQGAVITNHLNRPGFVEGRLV